ncbi:MHYT domain-containing protein [Microtetraspora niveoalba]|uniref:MHYT domain-containing protein n=1 Tax=Microtetraspora niveoalba TaxID=46175 RepID=UPI00082C9459|nr:MHYT domain-containing protein [Microtetraspora niveoalba]
MAHINHFSYGLLTPLLAYVMSSIGSMLGLMLTARARFVAGGERVRWLVGGAVSIGGTGIWVMHFIAMMGFDVGNIPIRYDIPLTVASALIAVAVVGAGLFIVAYGGARPAPLLAGGALTGGGVACMHYVGMAAMNMPGHVSYDPAVVTGSVLIAVVAATAALWFTLRVRGALPTTGAALIMGVAVSGMHYTGMFAMSVRLDPDPGTVPGAQALDFLVPLLVLISMFTLVMLLSVILAPSEHELRAEAELEEWLAERREGSTAPLPAGRHHHRRRD